MSLNLSEADKFAFATGYCMFSWAKVEAVLCSLFAIVLDPRTHAAVTVWDSILTFKDKLKALNSAIESRLYEVNHTEFLDIWGELVTTIGTYAKLRNEVAHGTLKPNNQGLLRLVPYFSYARGEAQGITIAMIEGRTQNFEGAAFAVIWCQGQIANFLGVPLILATPEPELIQALRQKISSRKEQKKSP